MTLVDEHTPEPMVAADAVHAVERKEQRRLVADAFGRLTPAQAEMLRLRVVDELSYKEVAEVTGSTVANVGYQLHAAVRKLREEVSK